MQGSRVIFAIDIETRGQGAISHGIISIGVCIGSADREEIFANKRFDILPRDGQVMEERCLKSFWSKHEDKLKKMTNNAKDAETQMNAFRGLLDKWDKTNEVYLVCDNPGFDFGIINTYLDMFKLPVLNYKSDGMSYRNTHDCDSYARGYLGCGFDDVWVDNKELVENAGLDVKTEDHDHMPENDARVIYLLHLKLVKHIKAERGREKKKRKEKKELEVNAKSIDTNGVEYSAAMFREEFMCSSEKEIKK